MVSLIKPGYLYLLLFMWLFICIIDIESEMYTATTSYGLVKYNEAGPAKQLLYPVLVSFA